MRRQLLAAISVLAIFAGAASAEQAIIVPTVHDFAAMLPSPSKPGDQEENDELTTLKSLQSIRGPKVTALAQTDAANRNIFLFATIFGANFNAKDLPATAALSVIVEQAVKSDIEPVKKVFSRARPYQVDSALHPVCPADKKDDSYPSGHTMSGYLEALTLASIVPEKKDEILARASDYATNRMICGVHFPSDIYAGKLLAYALFPILTEDPRFQAARNAAQAELRKALKLQAAAK